jgi:CubicO group peptidase (beta-lactamase class C family)
MFRLRFGPVFTVTGMLVLGGGVAQAAESLTAEGEQRVVDYVTTEMESLGVPGVAVVVVQGAEVVFSQGFGVTRSGGQEITASTPFHLASVSKSLTALAVMQVIESGALSLEDSLAQLLPSLVPEGSDAGLVTVADLLGHTSGWTERDGLVNRVDPDLSAQALELNVVRILSTPLSHPIGEFEYSNANYDVLGYVIEQVSGEPYGDYMRSHVFEPLAMTHSFTSEGDAVAGGVASGHYPFFGFVRQHRMVYVPGSVPSSYLAASAEDLGHFLIAQLNEGRYGEIAVLSPDGVATLQDPLTRPNPWDGYAMGLWVYPLWNAGQLIVGSIPEYRVPVVLEHGGDSESYASSILLLPEERVGVVVLLNLNDESTPSRYHQLHLGIASILLGREPAPTVAYEGAIERNAKAIALLVVGLFLLRGALSFRRLRRTEMTSVPTQVILPLMVDVVLVAAVWWFLADQADAPMAVVRRSVPDVFLAAVVASVIALGWGIGRTILRLQKARRIPRHSTGRAETV